MAHKTTKVTVYILTATLAFGGMELTAQASVLPGGGVSVALANGNKLEDVASESAIPIESIIECIQLDETIAPTSEPTEEDLFRNLVIAQVNSYVNVRSLPSEEGEILGKLYNNSVGTYIYEEKGSYQIT